MGDGNKKKVNVNSLIDDETPAGLVDVNSLIDDGGDGGKKKRNGKASSTSSTGSAPSTYPLLSEVGISDFVAPVINFAGRKLAINPSTVPDERLPLGAGQKLNPKLYANLLEQRIKNKTTTAEDRRIIKQNLGQGIDFTPEDNVKLNDISTANNLAIEKYKDAVVPDIISAILPHLKGRKIGDLVNSPDGKYAQAGYLRSRLRSEIGDLQKQIDTSWLTNDIKSREEATKELRVKKQQLDDVEVLHQKISRQLTPVSDESVDANISTDESGSLAKRTWNRFLKLATIPSAILPSNPADAEVVNHVEKLPPAFMTGLNYLKYAEPVEFERVSKYLHTGQPISETQKANITSIGLSIEEQKLNDAYGNSIINEDQYANKSYNIQKERVKNIVENKEVYRAFLSNGIAELADVDNIKKERERGDPIMKVANKIYGYRWNYDDDEIYEYGRTYAEQNGLDANSPEFKAAIKYLQDNEGAMFLQNSIAKTGFVRDLTKGFTGVVRGVSNSVEDLTKSKAEIYAESQSQGNVNVSEQRLSRINNSWEGTVADISEGTGQFLGQLALSYGTSGLMGALGRTMIGANKVKALAALGTDEMAIAANSIEMDLGSASFHEAIGRKILSSRDFTGTLITGAAQSYDSHLKQALSYTADDKTAARVATGLSFLEGLSENILSPLEIARGIKGNLFKTGAEAKGIIGVLSDANVLEKRSAIRDILKASLKGTLETGKVLVAESSEELVTQLADYGANAILNPESESFKNRNLAQETISTVTQTGLSMAIPALLSGVGAANTNNFSKGTLLIAAQNRQQLLDDMTDHVNNGNMTQDEFNEKATIINTAAKANSTLPKKATGDNLNSQEKADYIYSRVTEGVLSKKLEDSNDEAERNVIKDKIKEQQDYRTVLLKGTPEPTVEDKTTTTTTTTEEPAPAATETQQPTETQPAQQEQPTEEAAPVVTLPFALTPEEKEKRKTLPVEDRKKVASILSTEGFADNPELHKQVRDIINGTPDATEVRASRTPDVDTHVITKDNVNENIPATGEVADAAKKVAATVTQLNPNAKVVLHNTDESFARTYKEAGGQGTATGFFDNGNELHINLANANVETAFHEGAHSVFKYVFNNSPEVTDKFHSQLQDVLPDFHKTNLDKWVNDRYANEDDATKKDEYVTEFFARVASGKINLDTDKTFGDKVRELIRRTAEFFGLNPDKIGLNTNDDVRAFAKKLSDAFHKGTKLTPTEFDTDTEGDIKARAIDLNAELDKFNDRVIPLDSTGEVKRAERKYVESIKTKVEDFIKSEKKEGVENTKHLLNYDSLKKFADQIGEPISIGLIEGYNEGVTGIRLPNKNEVWLPMGSVEEPLSRLFNKKTEPTGKDLKRAVKGVINFSDYSLMRDMIVRAQKDFADQQDWYVHAGDLAKGLVGENNLGEFGAMWGITSAQSTVSTNLQKTLWAMINARKFDLNTDEGAKQFHAAYRTTMPNGYKPLITGAQVDKMIAFYRGSGYVSDSNIKTFVYSKLSADRGSNTFNPFSVMDTHMMRFFTAKDFKSSNATEEQIQDGLNDPKAQRAGMFITSQIAKELGIRSDQAQSLAWFYAKKNFGGKTEKQYAGLNLFDRDELDALKKEDTEGQIDDAYAHHRTKPIVDVLNKMVEDGTFNKEAPVNDAVVNSPFGYVSKAQKDIFSTYLYTDELSKIASGKYEDGSTRVNKSKALNIPNNRITDVVVRKADEAGQAKAFKVKASRVATEEIDRIKSLPVEEESGVTLNNNGTQYRGNELSVAVLSDNTTQDELTPELVEDFMDKIPSTDFKVGIYKFPNDNRVSVDLIVTVNPKNRDAAVEFARLAGHESIFDLGTGENIKTGEDGKTPMEFSEDQLTEIANSLQEGKVPDAVQPAAAEQQSPDTTNKSLDTQKFFSDTVKGANQPLRDWTPLVPFNERDQKAYDTWSKFRGSFDTHIETSIPAFRETQIKKIAAIANAYPEGGLLIDLMGSEGGFGKSVTELNPKMKSINLDMNPDMQEAHERTPVEGADFALQAFGDDVPMDDGTVVKRYEPPAKADVVHESMGFQFIMPDRKGFIDEVADHYIKPDGVFITEEKVIPDSEEEWRDNEIKKDTDFKSQYHTTEAIKKKGEEVLVGMKGNQADEKHLLDSLASRFDYVYQYWDSGNFKGYLASNSKEAADKMLNEIGDTTTEFTSRSPLVRIEKGTTIKASKLPDGSEQKTVREMKVWADNLRTHLDYTNEEIEQEFRDAGYNDDKIRLALSNKPVITMPRPEAQPAATTETETTEDTQDTGDENTDENSEDVGDVEIPEGIGLEATAATRAFFGLEAYKKVTVTDAALNAKVDRMIAKGKFNINDIIERVQKGDLTLSKEESVAVMKYKSLLDAEAEENPTDENIARVEALVDASDRARSEAGAILRLGRSDISTSFIDGKGAATLADFYVQEKKVKGRGLTAAEKNKIQLEFLELKKTKDSLQKKLDKALSDNAKLKAEATLKDAKRYGKKKGNKTSAQLASERQSIIDRIKEKFGRVVPQTTVRSSREAISANPEHLQEIANDVNEIFRIAVQDNPKITLQEVTGYIHGELAGTIPNITVNDVNDIIAGVHTHRTKPTKDEINKKIFELRQESKVLSDKAKIKSNEASVQSRKNKLNEQIAELKDRLNKGDYTKEVKVKPTPIPVDQETKDLKDRLIELQYQRDSRLAKEAYENRTKVQKTQDFLLELLNAPRTLMSSMDFSAVLRQGLIPTVAHPIIASKAVIEMFRQSVSQKRFDRWLFDLRESPEYDMIRQTGLYISDPHDMRLSRKEETFMNNLVERIPIIGTWLVKGSERAYISYLNKMRVDIFRQGVAQLGRDGIYMDNAPEHFEGLARMINNMTGRGASNSKAMELASPVLSGVFFSPRLIASRLNLLGFSDAASAFGLKKGFYGKLPPEVRKMALMDMGKFIVFGGTVLALVSAAFGGDDDDDEGVSVEYDPRSTDFGKIKVGDTRYDIWGGFQQYVRIAAQIFSGEVKDKNDDIKELDGEGFFGKTQLDVGMAAVRSKLAPVPSFAIDLLSRRTPIGEEIVYQWDDTDLGDRQISVSKEIFNHLLPIMGSDIIEIINDDERGADGTKAKEIFKTAIPSIFGIGVNTYK